MSDSCIFCKIISNEVKASIVYHDEQAVGTLDPEDEQVIGHIFTVARKLADAEGISNSGFRLITNTGAHGGQTVSHLHVHLIGGQRMRYPMG